jgi:phosphoadenosine phosphosulfate reductase
VKSVITGRRASQGAARASLQPLEIDSTGLLKLNPLFAWNFALVDSYIKENNVPRNKLLDQGYRSVGDWHSTTKVAEGQDERAGRWAGKEKTECGLHEDYFKMRAKAKAAAAEQAAKDAAAKGEQPCVMSIKFDANARCFVSTHLCIKTLPSFSRTSFLGPLYNPFVF